MTGRDLIMWILENEAEDAQFEVQYRDYGGDYEGTDKRLYLQEDGHWNNRQRMAVRENFAVMEVE